MNEKKKIAFDEKNIILTKKPLPVNFHGGKNNWYTGIPGEGTEILA